MSERQKKIETLGSELAAIYRDFPEGDKTVAIHLFGIRFGRQMTELSRAELDAVSVAAGLKPVYGLELRKMVKLSAHL